MCGNCRRSLTVLFSPRKFSYVTNNDYGNVNVENSRVEDGQDIRSRQKSLADAFGPFVADKPALGLKMDSPFVRSKKNRALYPMAERQRQAPAATSVNRPSSCEASIPEEGRGRPDGLKLAFSEAEREHEFMINKKLDDFFNADGASKDGLPADKRGSHTVTTMFQSLKESGLLSRRTMTPQQPKVFTDKNELAVRTLRSRLQFARQKGNYQYGRAALIEAIKQNLQIPIYLYDSLMLLYRLTYINASKVLDGNRLIILGNHLLILAFELYHYLIHRESNFGHLFFVHFYGLAHAANNQQILSWLHMSKQELKKYFFTQGSSKGRNFSSSFIRSSTEFQLDSPLLVNHDSAELDSHDPAMIFHRKKQPIPLELNFLTMPVEFQNLPPPQYFKPLNTFFFSFLLGLNRHNLASLTKSFLQGFAAINGQTSVPLFYFKLLLSFLRGEAAKHGNSKDEPSMNEWEKRALIYPHSSKLIKAPRDDVIEVFHHFVLLSSRLYRSNRASVDIDVILRELNTMIAHFKEASQDRLKKSLTSVMLDEHKALIAQPCPNLLEAMKLFSPKYAEKQTCIDAEDIALHLQVVSLLWTLQCPSMVIGYLTKFVVCNYMAKYDPNLNAFLIASYLHSMNTKKIVAQALQILLFLENNQEKAKSSYKKFLSAKNPNLDHDFTSATMNPDFFKSYGSMVSMFSEEEEIILSQKILLPPLSATIHVLLNMGFEGLAVQLFQCRVLPRFSSSLHTSSSSLHRSSFSLGNKSSLGVAGIVADMANMSVDRFPASSILNQWDFRICLDLMVSLLKRVYPSFLRSPEQAATRDEAFEQSVFDDLFVHTVNVESMREHHEATKRRMDKDRASMSGAEKLTSFESPPATTLSSSFVDMGQSLETFENLAAPPRKNIIASMIEQCRMGTVKPLANFKVIFHLQNILLFFLQHSSPAQKLALYSHISVIFMDQLFQDSQANQSLFPLDQDLLLQLNLNQTLVNFKRQIEAAAALKSQDKTLEEEIIPLPFCWSKAPCLQPEYDPIW